MAARLAPGMPPFLSKWDIFPEQDESLSPGITIGWGLYAGQAPRLPGERALNCRLSFRGPIEIATKALVDLLCSIHVVRMPTPSPSFTSPYI